MAKHVLRFGILCLLLVLPLAARACPPPPPGAVNPTVRMEVVEPRLIYRHDLDLLGLAKITDTFETAAKGWVLLGLTRRNDIFLLEAKVLAQGGCLWVEEVTARLGGEETDVYIAANYEVGTCEYNAVRDHENGHVAINSYVLKTYAPRIGAGLRQAVHTMFPLAAGGADGGKAVPAMLSASVNGIYQEMISELRRRNQALDAPENYRRTQQLCHNWFPPGTPLPKAR